MKSISIAILKEQLENADVPLLYITLKNVLVDTLKITGKVSFEIKDGGKPEECTILITAPDNTQEIADLFFAKHILKEQMSFMITEVKDITVVQ